ncbi:MAG: SIS domain-containing protein [Chloroflexi bacterium]|nr:SIS domain-containing protein [Chloroflexota bacterium]
MTDRVDQLHEDILAGPAALQRLLDAYDSSDSPLARVMPALRAHPRIAFTGLGSSRYAASIAATALRASGASAWVEYASTGAPTAPAPNLTMVAVSASGRTPEVVAAARRHRGRSFVIAVTNDPDSALAAEADEVMPLHAGTEGSGIATRTFRATVALLAMIAGRTPASLAGTVAELATAFEGRKRWLSDMADAFDGASAIDVLADAAILGLADQAALMLREAPRLPATAHDTGDWLHTAVYLALPGHRALLFPGAAADAEVIATIERRGGVVVSTPGPVDADPFRRVMVDSVCAEILAVELWRRTSSAED